MKRAKRIFGCIAAGLFLTVCVGLCGCAGSPSSSETPPGTSDTPPGTSDSTTETPELPETFVGDGIAEDPYDDFE